MQLDPGGQPTTGPLSERARRRAYFAEDGPIIADPFVRMPSSAPPPAHAPSSAFAIASLSAGIVAFALGPLAGIAALIFGVLGRAETRDGGRSGRRRATAGMVLGVLASALWSGAAIAGWMHWRGLLGGDDTAPVAAPLPMVPPADDAPAGSPRDRRVGPGGTVPQTTTIEAVGTITLVEVGVAEPSLAAALVEQNAAASAAGQKLLVTTTGGSCEPCEGFVASLPDPAMQEALANMRVVRVDVHVFGDDLDALRLRRDVLPGYFLLDFDLAPKDAIHGGEWGEDIAANIAPVLGPFVRGALRQRKHTWPLPAAPRKSSSDPRRGGGIWL